MIRRDYVVSDKITSGTTFSFELILSSTSYILKKGFTVIAVRDY